MYWIKEYFISFADLFNEMAIYLLLGFAFAGILNVFLRKERIARFMGGENLKSVFNAALLGIPLPLCSCGVIPTGLSLYKNGASKGASVSFLISTPQTGIDSMLVSYSLLGLPMAIIRAVVALFTGVIGGFFTNITDNSKTETLISPVEKQVSGNKLIKALHYGFVEFVADIAKWLMIGLAIAAFFAVLIPDNFFTTFIHYKWLNMLLVLLASIPLYVCATGSVPIAAVLMLKGLSPGAALVFLMAGPATNMATITVLGNTLGKKTTIVYLLTISAGAMFFGFLIDSFLPASWFGLNIIAGSHKVAHLLPAWLHVSASIILAILLFNAFIQKIISNKKEKKNSINIKNMDMRFKVEGMTCKNCKAHVENSVKDLDGVENAVADLDSGELAISGSITDKQTIIEAVAKAGYSAKEE
jgi:uncharacterized protein